METMAQKRRGKRVAKSKAVFEGVGIPGVFRPQPPSPRRKKQSKAKTKTPSPAATSSTMGEGGPVRGTTDHSVGVTFNKAEPIAPRNIAATGASAGSAFQSDASETAVTADTTAVTADTASATVPILIAPTIYPREPGGTISVQNHTHITINIQGNHFRDFNGTMADLHEALRDANAIGANAIGPEVRQQLIAETSAGTELLKAPKADRGLIDLLLLRPLTWLSTVAGAGERIAELALVALNLLNKMIG
jgi:hypothetical protein